MGDNFPKLDALFITLKSEVYNLSETLNFKSLKLPMNLRPLPQLTDHSANSQTTPPTHGPLPAHRPLLQLTDHSPNSQTTPTHRPRPQLTDHANSQTTPTHRPRQLTDHAPNSQTTPTHRPLPQLTDHSPNSWALTL